MIAAAGAVSSSEAGSGLSPACPGRTCPGCRQEGGIPGRPLSPGSAWAGGSEAARNVDALRRGRRALCSIREIFRIKEIARAGVRVPSDT